MTYEGARGRFSPLFNPAFPEDAKKILRDNIGKRFNNLRPTLEKNAFLMGGQFTVADAYLVTVANRANFLNMDLSPYPWIQAYLSRVSARPHMQAALKAEGLVK